MLFMQALGLLQTSQIKDTFPSTGADSQELSSQKRCLH